MSDDGQADIIETIRLGMYEAGGEEGSGFHVYNIAANQYHRGEVLQRTGAIDITCSLEKVIYGVMSTDSDRYATLIVMQWFFQPKGSRRISEATIELVFDTSSDDSYIEVEKISFLGTYSLMPTTQQETSTKGIAVAAAVGQFATISFTSKWEKTVSRTTSDATTLSGRRRLINNTPPNRIATWTLSENQSQPAGIPTSLRVGVLISRDDRAKFFCRVALRCKTDLKTAAESVFKSIPKDDMLIFQPCLEDKGKLPNKNVVYNEEEELEKINLDTICGVP
ncbi:hypothetical protein F4860DRAFT_487561 [Xylaria cubensis]|nr:hypothetical protein F4860DRAFT_487561 [Xylaria cubensis]